MKKFLWLTSFRPIGVSKANDIVQDNFIQSVKNINGNITFSLTQFEEPNINEYINSKNIKYIFHNVLKKDLGTENKYSNKIMLENALKDFIAGNFDYLIHSTADLQVSCNLLDIVEEIDVENKYCALIYPNILVKNGVLKSSNWPHFGIDLFIFKISKEDAKKLLYSIKNWKQYNWGIIDNFYISICDLLELKIINLYKKISVIKFENNFKDFKEDLNWQKKNWKINFNYFKKFLKENNLSILYAYGSYYYILIKIFRIKDMNLNLILSYIKFFIYFPLKKIVNYFFYK